MTEEQWYNLKDRINSIEKRQPEVAFIIDSPWLPGFYNISALDYYFSGIHWFKANVHALESFPEITFLPGFWSEFGMCTEPSAFGSKCVWNERSLPHAGKTIRNISEMKSVIKPDPRSDGLLPLVIHRLKEYQEPIQRTGHQIYMAVSRGPLNIASFLMGTSEFMTAMVMYPEESHRLLRVITDFILDWLQLQKKSFPGIDGIFILDDMAGFVGDTEFQEFVVPYLKEIFHAFEASVRFFHNDASGLICSKYLKSMGINLFNFSYEHSLEEILNLTDQNIILLGNLPPRDVLAQGREIDVRNEVKQMFKSVNDRNRIIWSCGGGMPPNVPGENIKTFYQTVLNLY